MPETLQEVEGEIQQLKKRIARAEEILGEVPATVEDRQFLLALRQELVELRKEKGRLAAAAAASTSTPSPRCAESCFLLIDKGHFIVGTAVAVSEEYLLTAAHCIGKKSANYYITPMVEKANGKVVYPRGRQLVRVLAVGKAMEGEIPDLSVDYAVLQLQQEKNPRVAPLPRLIPLPIFRDEVYQEMQVKLYSAFQATEFNDGTGDVSGISANSPEKVCFVSKHHLFINRGYFCGCSGGPYVTHVNGVTYVAGLHIESSNSIPDIKDESVSKISGEDAVSHRIVQLEDVISKASNAHGRVSRGLIISKCKKLYSYLCDTLGV